MKPIAAFAISALMLVPAMALAETSPSGGGTSTRMSSKPNMTAESSENREGQKFYPDWAAVKKMEGASQKGATEANQAGQSDPTKSAGVKPNEASKGSEQQSKDRPGLVEKAEQIIGTITGRSTPSNDSETGAAPGLVGKAEQIIGTITGRSTPSNDSETGAASKGGAASGEPRILGTLTGVIEIAPANPSAANDAVASTTAALQGRTSVPIIIRGELKIDKSVNSNEGSSNTSSR